MAAVKYLVASTLVWVAGCASNASSGDSADPFEGINRSIFAFNSGVDRAVLKPVSEGYRFITTEDMREGISNALANLKEPVTAANQVLQGDFVDAGETVGRFMTNSTLGVAGLIDVTGHYGHERKTEDFGQTLAVWGVPDGPYLMLPFFGPSNPRDLAGSGVNSAMQPLTWAQFEGDDAFRISRTVLGVVSAREANSEQFDQLYDQVDPYTALRRIYVQTRGSAIRNGAPDPSAYEDLPDYDDYDY